MCGIAGFLQAGGGASASAEAVLRSMTGCLAHRGPDSSGTRIINGPQALLAFGHSRLAVVDLSQAGSQPMTSADGRFTIIYNGEVYDTDSLRAALVDAGHVFRGHSDTEVILEYAAHWGMEAVLPQLEGMFALALWDDREKVLTLARDPAGIKPLYWTMRTDGTLVFASELKALEVFWGPERPRVSAQASLLYAQNGYVPAPHTIYEGAFKLKPGHMLRLGAGGGPQIAPFRLWKERAADQDIPDWGAYMHDILSESVRVTLNADVPVGCFLSGGIDSSLVTALMQAHSARPVKTFAIGFDQPEFNEAPYAAAIARHLGTEHTELIVSERDMLDVLPMLAGMYDEPFADSSQIPTYLVSKLARAHVTVALSGDGGDELFSGYTRYRTAVRAARIAAFLPAPLRNILGSALPALRPVIGGPSRISNYARLLGSADFGELYNAFLAYDIPLSGAYERALRAMTLSLTERLPMGASADEKTRLMRRADFGRYMVDDVLTKVDRASMKVSLETRVPLLNGRVIEAACRLPASCLTDGINGKMILRDALARYVPRPLFERPKMGFGVPLGAWIRGPLRDYVSANIDMALRADAPFDPLRTRRALAEHLSGARDHGYVLWIISTYGDWMARR